MRRVIAVWVALLLTACAHLNSITPDEEFENYRAELRTHRDAATITTVEEQERLRDEYWHLFGKDPESAAHFAFAISLMQSVQAGKFPLDEADALIAAREQAVFALRIASRQLPSSYEYPPN